MIGATLPTSCGEAGLALQWVGLDSSAGLREGELGYMRKERRGEEEGEDGVYARSLDCDGERMVSGCEVMVTWF